MSVFNRFLNGRNCGCTDLLACVYELNALESAAYLALLQHAEARMEDLADELDRDRSTVYRAVQKLMNIQLAERQTVSMKGGGYYYVYQATEPARVRQLIEQRLETFQGAVHDALSAFEEDVAKLTAADGARAAGTHGPGHAAAERSSPST